MKLKERLHQTGAAGYILLWLLGIPIPVLFISSYCAAVVNHASPRFREVGFSSVEAAPRALAVQYLSALSARVVRNRRRDNNRSRRLILTKRPLQLRDFGPNRFFSLTKFLLQTPKKLVVLAVREGKIVIGQLTIFLFQLPFHFIPAAFEF